jgi:DNA invertase Pin-like site-specific DNA recombinase
MIFTVLGAVAELERSLIVERVKAGLRNARAKGKKLGRPRADVRESQIEGLRASGASWRAIAKEMGVGVGTVHRIGQRRSKNVRGARSERQSEMLYAQANCQPKSLSPPTQKSLPR